MTKLPTPEQWVLTEMNEMEVAEMIEEYIDYQDEDGRSVHLPMQFVRHFMKRKDSLPTVVAIATLPIVLADGGLLAPDGLDRDRGIVFEIQKEVRASIPSRKECTDEKVRKAMEFLCNEWLVDVNTNYDGKCILIALALTLIERSLLPDRPAFFVTAGRRGGGKTTTLIMIIFAVTGIMPAAAAWSTNEEERRKALLSYFLYGVAYILWDNIARGSQISCPHIEKSCTSAYYSDRKLGVSELVAIAAAVIHILTGNNIGPRGDFASRSLHTRTNVDRPDPENREFKHPDPIGWTEDNRVEILGALYTILLGNPMLKEKRDAAMKTRFKMWWRLVGSAVEHAAELFQPNLKEYEKVDFQKLFLAQDDEDEDSVSLADALTIMVRRWPKKFKASNVVDLIIIEGGLDSNALQEFFYPGAPPGNPVTAKSIGRLLKKYVDDAVKQGDETLILRRHRERSDELSYWVERKKSG